MKQYRLEATSAVELDIEATFNWYEREEVGLGLVFLNQLRDAYVKILDHPLGYIKSYARPTTEKGRTPKAMPSGMDGARENQRPPESRGY